MDMEQVLQSSLEVLADLQEKRKLLDEQLSRTDAKDAELTEREKKVTKRELAAGAVDDIETSLASIKQLRQELDDARATLEKDRADFSNEMVRLRQALRDEETALNPVRELANQVRQDKAALEKEKKTYKEKIKAEILNQLKAGK